MSMLVHQQIGDCVVAVIGAGSIGHDEYEGVLRALEVKSVTKHLTIAIGPTTINSKQRRQAVDTLKRRNLRVAVVTASSLTAGIVTALRWLDVMDIRTFTPNALCEALGFLELSRDERTRVLALLAEHGGVGGRRSLLA